MNRRQASVLIVEDTVTNQELVRMVLETSGYAVTIARDGREMDAALALATPDCILMDVGLPGEDGLSLTRRLKAGPTTRHIPLLVLTAAAMRGDAERAAAAGADAYLSKPFAPNHLIEVVAQLLASSEGHGAP